MLEMFSGVKQTPPVWMPRKKIWFKVTVRSKVKWMRLNLKVYDSTFHVMLAVKCLVTFVF